MNDIVDWRNAISKESSLPDPLGSPNSVVLPRVVREEQTAVTVGEARSVLRRIEVDAKHNLLVKLLQDMVQKGSWFSTLIMSIGSRQGPIFRGCSETTNDPLCISQLINDICWPRRSIRNGSLIKNSMVLVSSSRNGVGPEVVTRCSPTSFTVAKWPATRAFAIVRTSVTFLIRNVGS